MSDPKFTCPRRTELGASPEGTRAGTDTWQIRGGEDLADRIRHCSWCGSMHPDDVMAHLANGSWVLGPTDKSYKAYISEKLTAAERAKDKNNWLKSSVAKNISSALASKGIPATKLQEALEAHYDETIAPVLSGRDRGKFYYQHLSAKQRLEFIQMINAKAIKFGYPGHLYVLPYFATTRKQEGEDQ